LIESSDESSRYVSLGAPFLKAGYVRLDYENNQIILGDKDAVEAISKDPINIHPVGPEVPKNDTKPVVPEPKENKTEPV